MLSNRIYLGDFINFCVWNENDEEEEIFNQTRCSANIRRMFDSSVQFTRQKNDAQSMVVMGNMHTLSLCKCQIEFVHLLIA